MSTEQLKEYLINNIGDPYCKGYCIFTEFGFFYRETRQEANKLIDLIPRKFLFSPDGGNVIGELQKVG